MVDLTWQKILNLSDPSKDFDIHLENSTCYEALDPSINVFVIIDPMVNFTYAPIDLLKSSYKFDWDEGKIGILNAAYYFGYVPAIIPGRDWNLWEWY